MQEPRDSFSNEDEEQKWPGVATNQQNNNLGHSRNSSRPLDNSGSLMQEEFGSAEAMEYTPSNTSQNNSIPTHLVTNSNSNLNMSHVKGSSIILGGNNLNVSQSPLPYNYSQIEQSQTKVKSFKEQQSLNQLGQQVNNRIDFSQGNTAVGGQAQQQNRTGSLMTQEPSIMTQSIPGMTNNANNGNQMLQQPSSKSQHMGAVEDDFFDHHASFLMQQQRSSTKQAQQPQQQQQQQQQVQQQPYGGAAPQRPVNNLPPAMQHTESSQQIQMISQSTTPGFQQMSESAQQPPYVAVQGNSDEQFQHQSQGQNINIQNFSVSSTQQQQQVKSQQLQNPPRVANANKRPLPHQTISLVQQQQQQVQQQQQQIQQHYGTQQPSQQPSPMSSAAQEDSLIGKLQQKIREQAQRLQGEAQYRLLCEKRIRKLDPQHPLPVQFEHLELSSFSPQQMQFGSQQQQSHTGQAHQQEQSRQLISHLQNRVSDLNKQVGEKQILQQRLKQTEESLRNEVLQAEEQRAYIEMLKDQVDQKIKNIGLSFDADPSRNPPMRSNSRLSNNSAASNSLMNRSLQNIQQKTGVPQTRQIDGLLQISSLQKVCEDLKAENEILNAKLEQSGINLTQALNEQREALFSQIEQLQNQLQQEHDNKNHLVEKNDTLMEYANQNIDRTAEQEAKIAEVERLRQKAESQVSQSIEKTSTLEKELEAKSTLLDQVKQNLEEIRSEKITIQAHMESLTIEKDDQIRKADQAHYKTQEAKNSRLDEIQQLQGKLTEKESENKSLQEKIKSKDDSIQSIEKRLNHTIESEKQLKESLNAELVRAQNANNQNFTLKHTLVDSQQEMDTLVNKYDHAVEDLIKKDHKIAKMTDDLLNANREVEKLIQSNVELRNKAELQAKELVEVYGSLRRKEEVLRNMEDRLSKKLNDREEQCMTMQSKLNHLEQTFSKETNNAEQLRRMCSEQTQLGANLENTLKEKDDMIRDMKAEVHNLRVSGERAYREREDELLRQIQQKSANEFGLTQESNKLQQAQTDLVGQTQNAQKIIEELKRQVKDQTAELQKKEEGRKRWEDEVKRVESASNCTNMQYADLQKDYDRIRQQQVDDALLIDRMRISHGEMKDQVNEIVGRITKFGYNLEEIGQSNLPQEIESAYEISKQISPCTQDLTPALDHISRFIRPLSNEVVEKLRNVPERDSDKGSHQHLEQSNVQSMRSQEHIGQFYQNQHSQSIQSNNVQQQQIVPVVANDLRQFEQQSRNHQQQASNFTFKSQKQNHSLQNNEIEYNNNQIQSIEDSANLVSFQQTLAQQEQSMNQLHQTQLDAFQTQNDHMNAEIESQKNSIATLEQRSLLDHEVKEDLERAVKVVLQITNLASSYKLLLQELFMRIKDTDQARREKFNQSSNLLQMEQKYHFQSKQQLNNAVQVELTILKQGIVRERNRLHELEIALKEQDAQQQRILEDILRTNAYASDTNAEQSLKMKRLQEQCEEANLQRKEMQEQLDWTQALLQEQRSLRNRFQPGSNSGAAELLSQQQQPSQSITSQPAFTAGAALRTKSKESGRQQQQPQKEHHEQSVESQSALKNYLPPLNDKTDLELKSEEFNRKQMISSSRERENYHQSYEKAKLGTQFRVYTGLEGRQQSEHADHETHSFNPTHQQTPETRTYKQQESITPQSGLIDSQVSNQQNSHQPEQHQPTRVGNLSSYALRNRSDYSNDNSLSRSKSPSQASNVIRRKYSQMRTLDARPSHHEDNDYALVSPLRNLADQRSQERFTEQHLYNERPLRGSPQRQQQQQQQQQTPYGAASSTLQPSSQKSRSPQGREQALLSDLASNHFKRF